MSLDSTALADLAGQIRLWGKELGFAELRIADVDLSHIEGSFQAWLFLL